jgi:FkbM family methyltransferase
MNEKDILSRIPFVHPDPMTFFTCVPKCLRLAIYGAGKAGEIFHSFVKKNRPDLEVRCYISSFESGQKASLPVILPHDKEALEDIDLIVVCSYKHDEIIGVLKYLGISKYILFFSSPKYSLDYINEHKRKFSDAKKILFDSDDKVLFDLLLRYSTDRNVCLQEPQGIQEALYARNFKKHYTDFINFDAIETVFDCGSHTGDTAEIFLNTFSNIKKVHSFDISFTKEKIISHRPSLKNDSRFEFHPVGLSDRNEVCYLCPDGDDGGGNRLSSDSVYNQPVQCTSLDIFVESNGIDRVDYIKMDIEGAETKALLGCRNTISRFRPQLSICSYHGLDDFWRIPLTMKRLCKNYIFRVGHYSPSLVETVIYGIPREIYS